MTDNKTKRLLRSASETCRMEVTPMIDVTFLLLVFFMCTLKFRVLEGTLDAHLPKDVGLHGHEHDFNVVNLRINVAEPGTKVVQDWSTRELRPMTAAEEAAGLRFSFGDDRIVEFTVNGNTFRSVDEVIPLMKMFITEIPDARLTIDVRDGTAQQEVVPVLDAVRELGFSKIRFSARLQR